MQREYLEALPNGRFQLGGRFGRLGMAYGRHASFAIIARKALADLASSTRMIAELVVVDDWTQFVPLAAVDKANPYLRSSEGARIPLPHTASAPASFYAMSRAKRYWRTSRRATSSFRTANKSRPSSS